MKKIIIISFISVLAGALIVLTGYFVYSVIKIQNQVAQNTATLGQIVTFLNQEIAKTATPTTK